MFDYTFPYPSQRMPVLARNSIATSQPLAAQAGMRMLLAGGNAVDAALAAAIALTVVEPTSNGIGGDAFAIIWDGRQLNGLNASGRSPAALSPDRFAGRSKMPFRGWDSVTVPGAPSAWAALSERYGQLPFERLFEPAIGYARDGFLVSPITAGAWRRAEGIFAKAQDFGPAFLPGGRAPKAGELFRFADQAVTLEQIAASKSEAFYRGALADRIAEHARSSGGLLSEQDLAEHQIDWVDTVSQSYRGVELHEIPPNGQGLAALQALAILEQKELGDFATDSADSLHLQIEATKLALADAYRYVADPEAMDVTAAELLDPGYIRERAELIDMRRAQDFGHGEPKRGGTVYLTAADENGMMISYIQSNYSGFGSGVVVPGTGISLQNRGGGFTLEQGHPNQVGPRKRPFHTIIPAFLMEAGQPRMSFGVMGGPMQAQGHVQMVTRIHDHGQNPQAAADAPRWRVMEGLEVAAEPGFRPEVIAELQSRGHQVKQEDPGESFSFGGAQLIHRLADGYLAASDWRKDGQALGY